MNRRDSVRSLVAAAWATVLWRPAAAQVRAPVPPGVPAPGRAAPAALDAQLKSDVERLAPRVYSDEGIPMLLACVDVTRGDGAAAATTAFNAALAAELRATGAAWERLYPEAKTEDASKLLEVLADRDFAAQLRRARR